MGAGFKFKNTIDVSKLAKDSPKNFYLAQFKAAMAMLDWMSSGSQTSPKKPPIRTGVLASSGSVFYKNRLLGTSPNVATSGAPTPNKSHTGKNITWGFNTDYAKRMHEDKSLNPGPFSKRDPNMAPGNQWVTEHLQKDKDNYTKLIAEFIKGKLK
jgi:hypothetical protein